MISDHARKMVSGVANELRGDRRFARTVTALDFAATLISPGGSIEASQCAMIEALAICISDVAATTNGVAND